MDYQCLADFCKVLSNPVRLKIITCLSQNPCCVNELVCCTRQRQAYISQQLMYLRSKGWVDFQKDGVMVFYHLADTRQTKLMKFLITEAGLQNDS
jgi:ArsR family transcriptional regulator